MNSIINDLNPIAFHFAGKILKHYPLQQNKLSAGQSTSTNFHMHDHRKERQIYERTTEQKLSHMKTLKEQGNVYYKEAKYQQAVYYYEKMIVYGDYTFPKQKQQMVEMQLLLEQVNTNLALCMIKTNQWKKAEQYLLRTIGGQSSVKSYYLLTKVYVNMGRQNKVQSMIVKLKNLRAQKNLLQDLQEYIKNSKKKNSQLGQKIYLGIFK